MVRWVRCREIVRCAAGFPNGHEYSWRHCEYARGAWCAVVPVLAAVAQSPHWELVCSPPGLTVLALCWAFGCFEAWPGDWPNLVEEACFGVADYSIAMEITPPGGEGCLCVAAAGSGVVASANVAERTGAVPSWDCCAGGQGMDLRPGGAAPWQFGLVG